jgi:hypothetical protein
MEKQCLVLVLSLLARTSAGEQTVWRIVNFLEDFLQLFLRIRNQRQISNLADFDGKSAAHSSKNGKNSYKCVLEIYDSILHPSHC